LFGSHDGKLDVLPVARASVVNLGDGFAARVVRGPGDVAFWIHGYTLSSECWAGLWSETPRWSHIGIDLPGHGNSLPLGRDEQLSTLADQISELAIGCRARHLVALSFGTVIALQMTIQHPTAFATLTIVSPILGGGPFDPGFWQKYHEAKVLFPLAGHGSKLRDLWMAPDANLFSGLSDSPFGESIRRQVLRHPWWDLADDTYARLWHTPQSLRKLQDIVVPTLLLVGEADCGAVKQCAYLLGRAIQDCTASEIVGRGHLSMLEDPIVVKTLIEEHWCKYAEQKP
jgi:2-succinyl-6-hydroxy-2,4-cyclohexadiene-1-carboxylate synthase